MSLADEKIILTSQWRNFNLFSFEGDDWTESVVEYSEEILILEILSEQLLVVRNLASER